METSVYCLISWLTERDTWHQLSVALSLSVFITFGSSLHQLWPLNISMLKSLVLFLRFSSTLKILNHLKMKIISSFSHTYVLPNPRVIYYYFLNYFCQSWKENFWRIFTQFLFIHFPQNKSSKWIHIFRVIWTQIHMKLQFSLNWSSYMLKNAVYISLKHLFLHM